MIDSNEENVLYDKYKQVYDKSPSFFQYSDKTVEWIPSDTKDNYLKNINDPIKKKLLKKNGWIDSKIEYKFNKHGFRCSEFSSSKKGIMFLGCSFTFGVGLPKEDTWAYQLSQELKLKEINLSCGGGSSDYCVRMCFIWLAELKPSIVVCLLPPIYRFEYVDFRGQTDLKHVHGIERFSDKLMREYDFNSRNVKLKDLKDFSDGFTYFYDAYTIEESNTVLNRLKNVYAMKNMCEYYGVKFLCLSDVYYLDIRRQFKDDLARDLFHAGKSTNKEIKNIFLKNI